MKISITKTTKRKERLSESIFYKCYLFLFLRIINSEISVLCFTSPNPTQKPATAVRLPILTIKIPDAPGGVRLFLFFKRWTYLTNSHIFLNPIYLNTLRAWLNGLEKYKCIKLQTFSCRYILNNLF